MSLKKRKWNVMKKMLVLLCAGLLGLGSLVGCGKNSDAGGDNSGEGNEAVSNPFEDKALADIVTEIYDKAGEMEMELMEPMTLEADAVQYYLGITDTSGIAEVVASEPFINVVPYSLCLARVNEGTDVEALRKQIFDGADARKWVCVSAEKVTVNHAGDVILLLMADADTTEQVYNAFAELAGDAAGERLERNGE